MKKLVKCDLCDNKDFKFLFEGKDRMYKIEGNYFLYQCKNCGLIFLNPQPNQKEIALHYPKNYCSFENKAPTFFSYFLYRHLYSDEYNIILKILLYPFKPFLRTSKIIPNGRILDIGCGAGTFLVLMKSFGMNCYGIDPGDANKDFFSKYDINFKKATLEKVRFSDSFFDVITMNHVFEHVHEPLKTMQELYRILKPNGTLIISVPNTKSFEYVIFKENWTQLDIPRHLFGYSSSIIEKYAIKTGFIIIKIKYNSKPAIFVGSLLYFISKKFNIQIYLKEKGSIKGKTFFTHLSNILFPIAYLFNILKRSDQIEIILTK